MKLLAVLLSIFSVVLARLEVLSPLDPAPDAPEGWLQVCCQDNDRNDDGGISFREFTPFVLEIMDLDRKTLGEIFLTGDLDRNSDLDGNECPIIRSQIRDRMSKKVQNALKTFDSDRDGRLSQIEVQNLGQKQFRLSPIESDEVFTDMHGPVTGSSVTQLLLQLRSKQLQKARGKLLSWDTDSNGRVSYEELRRAVNGSVGPLTLKQAFKQVDHDKDLHLSKVEFISLLNELERGKVDTVSIRLKRSEGRYHQGNEEGHPSDFQLSEGDFSGSELEYVGDGKHRIFPRSETAPPPADLTKVEISDSGEIGDNFAALLVSVKPMTGGGRTPLTETEIVTVKYDDPDFQRWRRI